MARVLITAYGPYDSWHENASWLALKELTSRPFEKVELTTRLYPVDFAELRSRLESDLAPGFDCVLHLGQAPGRGSIALEAFGVNVQRERGQAGLDAKPLAPDGPPAYRSSLPLEQWASSLRRAGIPADVSFYAGDYLCNAAMYWSHYFAVRSGKSPAATFLHLPLDTSQAVEASSDLPSLPAATSARAIRLLLETMRPAPTSEGFA
ncbi:MAG: pyroglutamyl-peptidase I [Planctomycetota bacterium]